MYHNEDLPFKLDAMPGCYGDFREKMTKVAVRQALSAPESIKGLPLGK